MATLSELEKRETIHYPTSLANVNNSTQMLLLWNIMAVTGKVKCPFLSCVCCAGQAVLAVSTAGDGCARGPHLGAVRPAGERRAWLLVAAGTFHRSLTACPRKGN